MKKKDTFCCCPNKNKKHNIHRQGKEKLMLKFLKWFEGILFSIPPAEFKATGQGFWCFASFLKPSNHEFPGWQHLFVTLLGKFLLARLHNSVVTQSCISYTSLLIEWCF